VVGNGPTILAQVRASAGSDHRHCGFYFAIEIARARDENTMIENAALLDRLRPKWLPERRSLQKEEVSAAFFKFLRPPYVRYPVLRPLAHVAADFVNRPIPIGRQYSAVEFAGVLRSNMKAIQAAYEQNRDARAATARAWKRGWFKDKHHVVLEAYIGPLLPDHTPAGIVLDPGSKRAFLEQVVLAEMPSIAVEHALFEDSLRQQQKFRAQTFLDRPARYSRLALR